MSVWKFKSLIIPLLLQKACDSERLYFHVRGFDIHYQCCNNKITITIIPYLPRFTSLESRTMKLYMGIGQWWLTPLVPALWRQSAGESLWIWGQIGPQSVLQDRQNHTQRPCVDKKKKKKKKQKNKTKKNGPELLWELANAYSQMQLFCCFCLSVGLSVSVWNICNSKSPYWLSLRSLSSHPQGRPCFTNYTAQTATAPAPP